MSGRALRCVALALAFASAAGSIPASRAAAELRAEEITSANVHETRIGGPDAIGGLGDYYLANDVVELVVDHPDRRHGLLNHGGSIVDLGLRDREDEDQLARITPLVNLSQRVFVDYDAIRAELDPDGSFARIVVGSSGMSSLPRGEGLARALDLLVPEPEELRDVRVETTYEVRPGEAFVRLRTRIENTGAEEAPVFAFGDLWMRGGRSLRAFLGNAPRPELSRGFHHRSFSAADILGSIDSFAPFSHVVMPGLPAHPPITYALFSPERSERGLSFFGVCGEHVNLVTSLRADPGWPEITSLRLLRALRSGIPAGESWEIERRLLVTGRSDVGSATDVILPTLAGHVFANGIEGRVVPSSVPTVVHVEGASGGPVTQLRAQDGAYAARLAPGDYRLVFRAEHHAPVVRSLRVRPGETERVALLRWPEIGRLRFDPAFTDGGPGRVVVLGVGDTPTPVFGDELLDFRLDGERLGSATETHGLAFVGGDTDPQEIPLPPGRYRLVATRGLEWDAAEQLVEVSAGDATRVPPFALTRIASLPDHVSADFHVHAQSSDDSATSNVDRLRDFLAAGVQVLVATDHENVADYDDAIARLGVFDEIRVLHGVEVTSSAPSEPAPWTLGHLNAWPIAHQPWAHRHGAPPSQRVSAGDLVARLHGEYGALVVQLNHPRGTEPGRYDGHFFTHQGSAGRAVDPELPLEAAVNEALLAPGADGSRAIDFDAIELMNGSSHEQYLAVRRDFHWLLRQGVRRTATANSDTHGPDELAGLPRNYVRVGSEPGPMGRLSSALREGRSFGTNGPLILRFQVGGGESGGMVRAREGRVVVDYEVTSAPWVPLDEVRVLVNGEVVRALPRRSGRFDISLRRDAFVTLEAGVPERMDPALWRARNPGLYRDALAPGFVPTAFANPVYVDADGDGHWTPPGLRVRRAGVGRPLLVAALGVALLGAALGLRGRAGRRATT